METMTYWNTRHEPIVYYMGHRDHPAAIKIGTTVNQITRIARFCKNRGDDSFFIIAKEPGDSRLEAQRQKEFGQYLVTGDWFFLTGALLEHVEKLSELEFEPTLSELQQ